MLTNYKEITCQSHPLNKAIPITHNFMDGEDVALSSGDHTSTPYGRHMERQK